MLALDAPAVDASLDSTYVVPSVSKQFYIGEAVCDGSAQTTGHESPLVRPTLGSQGPVDSAGGDGDIYIKRDEVHSEEERSHLSVCSARPPGVAADDCPITSPSIRRVHRCELSSQDSEADESDSYALPEATALPSLPTLPVETPAVDEGSAKGRAYDRVMGKECGPSDCSPHSTGSTPASELESKPAWKPPPIIPSGDLCSTALNIVADELRKDIIECTQAAHVERTHFVPQISDGG